MLPEVPVLLRSSYFPLSAIRSSISCSLIPTIASPRSVEAGVPCFGTMNITAKRNAYGRQLGSFHTDAEFDGLGQVPMTFIRAPYIAEAGEDVKILAEVDGKIVAARQGRQLVTAFHPELDGDTRIHEYFLNM